MKKENQIILDLLRFSLDKKLKNKIKSSLNKELDWGYILQTSRRHGVSPILYKTLKSLNFRKKILKDFENDYLQIYRRNSLYYKELDKILKAFEKENIDVIVLKGMYLAKHVYKDIGLRPMSDIDLLVRKDDLKRSGKIVGKKGYVFGRGSKEKSVEQGDHDFLYINKKKRCSIELHWRDFNLETRGKVRYNFLEISNFWKNKIKITNKQSYYSLSKEDLLVHLLTHISFHEFRLNISHFFDIFLIISRFKLNWDYIYNNYYNYRDKLYYALSLSSLFFPSFIRCESIKKFKPNIINIFLFNLIKDNLFCSYFKEYKLPNNQKILLSLLLINKPKNRLKELLLLLYAKKYNTKSKRNIAFYISRTLYLPTQVILLFYRSIKIKVNKKNEIYCKSYISF